MRIGIIGSAGRKGDLGFIDKDKYKNIVRSFKDKISEISGGKPATLVSGGAAVIDFIACILHQRNPDQFNIKLYLPAEFDFNNQYFVGGPTADVANFYHRMFSEKMGKNKDLTLIRMADCLIHNHTKYEVHKGFLERDKVIADNCDILLAATFGNKEKLKPGGTKHTWDCFGNRGPKFHLDLHILDWYSH